MKKQNVLTETAHRLTIVDAGEPIVTDCEAPSENEFQIAACSISQLMRLFFKLKERYFNDDLLKMATTFGFSTTAAQLLMKFEEELTPEVFARGDLLKTSGSWRLLELNIGSTVGGLFYASLPRLAGFSQTHDVLKGWAQITVEKHRVNGPLALIEDSAHVEHMRLSLPVMANEFSYFSKNPVYIVGHQELVWDGKTLKGPDGSIEYVSNLFNELDVVKAPQEYEPLLTAIRTQKVKMVAGPIYRLFANKGTLAVLHELAQEGKLEKHERKLVEEFIPETFFLNAEKAEQVLKNRKEWVLKPIDGFAGGGIYCGQEYSGTEWAEKIAEILNADNKKSYVVQKFIDPPLVKTELTYPDGKILDRCSRMLWGVFVHGDNYLGAFARAKPDQGSYVINHANGASVGPVPETHGASRWPAPTV